MASDNIDWSFRDANGSTLLHAAARALRPDWAQVILEKDRSLAGVQTHLHRTPGGWTPLMCAVETPRSKPGSQMYHALLDITTVLSHAMSGDALGSRSVKGSTVFHQIVARGHAGLIEVVARRFDQDGLARVLAVINNAVCSTVVFSTT